jgi:hypothetical protein
MPATLEAIALLGWMERDEVLEFLRKRCLFDPSLTEEQALAIWQPFRRRVEALPPRNIEPPRRRMLNPEDRDCELRF